MKTLLLVLAALVAISGPASAGAGWESRPKVCNSEELPDAADLTACKDWIQGVLTPSKKARCCGEGDAFIADAFEVTDKGFVAVITRDYPSYEADDGEGGTVLVPAVPMGTRVPIPNDKINEEELGLGNPTGHGIVFMAPGGDGDDGGGWNVYCYFSPLLS